MKKIKDLDDFMNESQSKDWYADINFREYVENNLPGLAKKALLPRDIEHIADLLKMLCDAYTERNVDDDFIEHLLKEDYKEAMLAADDVNRVALYVYIIFQLNKVPLSLRGTFKK